jgi:hypothetical protein
VVLFGDTVIVPEVAPAIGFEVFPEVPMYHCTVIGREPFAVTVSETL